MLVIKSFFDSRTSTLTYVVHAQDDLKCVIVDPVLDLDLESQKTFTESADKVIQYLNEQKLQPQYILETHVHADHLTGSAYFKTKFPSVDVVIGRHVNQVQEVFNSKLGVESKPSDFDILVADGDVLLAGRMKIEVIETPGHTPACVTYKIGDCLFTGDFIFMPDSGTGRCDFPLGSAAKLYESVQKIFALPDYTKIYVGHDYQPGGRPLKFETSVGEEKKNNIHLKNGISAAEYIKFREERDKTLSPPKLLEPSLKVNLRAGKA